MSYSDLLDTHFGNITKTVIGEMERQPEKVQKAFAWVILNRLKKARSHEDVWKMFDCWKDKEQLTRHTEESTNKQRIETWLRELLREEDPTNGAYYCYSPSASSRCQQALRGGTRVNVTNIGEYEFYDVQQ